jgi:hypothetical protein
VAKLLREKLSIAASMRSINEVIRSVLSSCFAFDLLLLILSVTVKPLRRKAR